jgi:CRISPR-associated endonuclease Csn1
LQFLNEADEDGITGSEKVLSVFEFRVPYYVGPLREQSNSKLNHWMVRKAEGKIYPWNFNAMVDLDASENAFIARMTNSCTYLPGEDVLPKNSLIYSAFEVLNEINNIKVNGNNVSVDAKQSIFNNVFMCPGKVTPKRIKNFLISNHYINDNDVLSGLDITVKSSLRPFLQFKNLVGGGLLTYSDVENIINRATYLEDKKRFADWLRKEYLQLPESEIKYISGLRFKEFGRLSRKLLCGIEGAVNTDTGEYMSVIRTMWETNLNLMQILNSDSFEFKKQIEEMVKEYYGAKKKCLSERLDEMYVSNAVKRPIIRTLDILKDIVKVQGCAPDARQSEKRDKIPLRILFRTACYGKAACLSLRHGGNRGNA